ncbi:MAG: ribose-phosphate diphosphokinase, partial [Candidatus Hodarchaeota archaeon]
QDARFRSGEAISLHIVRDLLEQVGTDMLITFDLHLHREGNPNELFNIPVVNLTAMEALAEYVVTQFKFENSIAIAPDEEAEKWAKVAAKALGGASFDVLAKKRDVRTGEIEIAPKNLAVEGKDVLIVDDIVSTGGTMATAVKMIKVQGAKRVVAACTHPLLIGGAYTNILRAGADALIGTNSIESPVSIVSIAPILAKAISDTLK